MNSLTSNLELYRENKLLKQEVKILRKRRILKNNHKLKIFEEFVIGFMKDKNEEENTKDYTIYDLWCYVHKSVF